MRNQKKEKNIDAVMGLLCNNALALLRSIVTGSKHTDLLNVWGNGGWRRV